MPSAVIPDATTGRGSRDSNGSNQLKAGAMTVMLDPPRPTTLDTARVSEAAHNAATELGRVDTKAGMLFAISIGLSAGLGTAEGAILANPSVPRLAAYGVGVALALIGGAMHQLLTAGQPNLDGNHGIVAYATAATEAEAARLVLDQRPAEILRWTARAAVAKYRRIRRASMLLRAALYATAATAAVTAVLALVG